MNTHKARYQRPNKNATATTQYGMVLDRQYFPKVEPTERQTAHILSEYGKRPLRIIGREVGLGTREARVVMERLKRAGQLPEGAGLGWRNTRYSTVAKSAPVPMGWATPKTRTVQVSQPTCPDGSAHHRLCGPLVERMIPGYYDTHERPEHGQEHQVCCKCLDTLTVRLWWSRGEDVEVCEVA